MNNSKRIAISGVFAERPLTGVTRYCWEIIKALDRKLPADITVDFVIPAGVKVPYAFSHIRTVEYGRNIRFLWINYYFLRYLRKFDAIGLNIGVNVPWLRPDIALIYDVNSIVNKQYFSRYHVMKTTFEKSLAAKKAKLLLTISDFSKCEISRVLGVDGDRIRVIPCAWDHETKVEADLSVLGKWKIDPGNYYFSLSSIAPTKNFKWVIESAKRNPRFQYVIAGSTDPKSFGSSALEFGCDNILYVARVTDGEAKALMSFCRAFLFPSFYEGFGIPPLEALACGSPIVVADIPVMHEVFGNLATYINPYNYDSSGEFCVKPPDQVLTQSVLGRYRWDRSASLLLEVLEELVK